MVRQTSYQQGRVEPRRRRRGIVWVLRYRLREGDRWVEKTEELKGCNTESQARRAALQRIKAVNRLNNESRSIISNSEVTTLSDFASGLWKQYARKLKPSTAYNYQSILDTHILPVLGDRALPAISPRDITEFLSGREATGLSRQTLLHIYSLLALLFNLAMEYDLIEVSPVRKKLHRPRPIQAEKPVLQPEEIRAVLQNVEGQYRTLFVCLALTGLRAGELFALRWSNVDLTNRRLMVTHSIWRGELGETKTKGSNRTLWLPRALIGVLAEHLRNCETAGARRDRRVTPDDFVFCKPDGKPLDLDHVRRDALYPALAAAGVKRGKWTHGFHLFRHSAATIVHAQTRDLKLTQQLLGHTRIGTTADIYTHVEGPAEEATEALAREILGDSGLTVAWNEEQVN